MQNINYGHIKKPENTNFRQIYTYIQYPLYYHKETKYTNCPEI